MQYGFGLPVRGELATYEGIVAMAQRGEALGRPCVTWQEEERGGGAHGGM